MPNKAHRLPFVLSPLTLRIIESGDPMNKEQKEQEDLKHIRETLDAFMSYVQTPAKVISWTLVAMFAGIVGEVGVQLFKLFARWGMQK